MSFKSVTVFYLKGQCIVIHRIKPKGQG